MFQWIRNEARQPSATIYITNITLNRTAMDLLENSPYVMLGINMGTRQVAIKPVSTQDIKSGLVANDELYKVSNGRSYGRIANRNFCTLINRSFGLQLNNEDGKKFPIFYDTDGKTLIVDFAGGEM